MKFNGSVPVTNTAFKAVSNGFNNGHWLFPEQMGGKDKVGFIYVVRDQHYQKLYLGKKSYWGTGKLNKGKESAWRQYCSSSKLLVEMIGGRPRSEFDFICLEEYKTKGTLSYSETWSLCLVEAPTSNIWYNTLIEKVSWKVKEPISVRHKERLEKAITWVPTSELK